MLSTAQFKLFSLKKIRKNFTIDYCVIENIVDQLVQKPIHVCIVKNTFSLSQNFGIVYIIMARFCNYFLSIPHFIS